MKNSKMLHGNTKKSNHIIVVGFFFIIHHPSSIIPLPSYICHQPSIDVTDLSLVALRFLAYIGCESLRISALSIKKSLRISAFFVLLLC